MRRDLTDEEHQTIVGQAIKDARAGVKADRAQSWIALARRCFVQLSRYAANDRAWEEYRDAFSLAWDSELGPVLVHNSPQLFTIQEALAAFELGRVVAALPEIQARMMADALEQAGDEASCRAVANAFREWWKLANGKAP
jgi:hypothetical protein